ncbi:uncharacterized protein LOC121404242 [Drosophila obscura]|uniref:uncharacterized protein LOC121404242 n=1 Tax=Drosophila obscura TaxID=7282 RepID=UPI001BB0F6B7|nr:uncharacterized protein LOC121404242 [Drosophila obscura]
MDKFNNSARKFKQQMEESKAKQRKVEVIPAPPQLGGRMRVSGTRVVAPRRTAKASETTTSPATMALEAAGTEGTRKKRISWANNTRPEPAQPRATERISWARQVELEEIDNDILDIGGPAKSQNAEVRRTDPTPNIASQGQPPRTAEAQTSGQATTRTHTTCLTATIPSNWEVPQGCKLSKNQVATVQRAIDDRKSHHQRRFKLWSEEIPDQACWVKIGRSGDVRLGSWFNAEGTSGRPTLEGEGGV